MFFIWPYNGVLIFISLDLGHLSLDKEQNSCVHTSLFFFIFRLTFRLAKIGIIYTKCFLFAIVYTRLRLNAYQQKKNNLLHKKKFI